MGIFAVFKTMGSKSRWVKLVLLAAIAAAIHFFSLQRHWVERYYAAGIYPYISKMLRYLFGWLPFSLGDLIYGAVIIWALAKIAIGFKKLIKRQYSLGNIKNNLYHFAITILLIYISFNLLWGLNYSRKGLAYQLSIKKEKYETADLILLDSLLVGKLNESRTSLLRQNKKHYNTKETIEAVTNAYAKINRQYPWLLYKPQSAKTSLWGWAGNYLGFIGYYNPFTGEAQLNTTVPKFIQPFTACHEVAHQLGYAKENEANFVAYLVASASTDTLLRYSTYFEMYLYAQSNLYFADSASAKYFSKKLIPAVKADIRELKDFNFAHQSPFEPATRWLYEKYLENNQQPAGLLTYEEVVGFLIAYYKKTGNI